ncbi:GAF and ANTAR domain-containing protein [Jidongwangia harbinensis]|uniref:GAF and ANTAR domain-containing protein n=1 Tax=Jidongwangia harbinensis TaxID=2878561 RepID=UPI001CD9CC41|nr:GAF and ANTAR domain-containing protein [Jidongwangia harbinensis]MCA2211734.1 GAF and ANTAR domain-containing protein [Jidongwangia harbinensis]
MRDRASVIRDLIAAQPGQSHTTTDYLQRVCRTAAETLSASGTGISVLTDDGVRGVCAASDPHCEQIEELQFVLGEGPCIDAFEARRPVLIPDLTDGSAARWPMYGPAAHAGGFCAVFAFPLQMGAARLGALDVLRDHPGPLSDEQLSDAMVFADITMEALLDQHEASSGAGVADEIEHRAEIFQAQGMVMVQIGGTIGEAMARMRAHAYAENRGMGEIARDVLNRKLQFSRDHP